MGRNLLAIAALRLVLGLVLGAGLALAMITIPQGRRTPSSMPAAQAQTAPQKAPVAQAQATPQEAPAGPRFAVYSSLHKLRPDRPLPDAGRDAIELRALRGECESAQVAIAAGEMALTVAGAALRGSLGEGVSLRVYREGIVRLELPSGPEGHAGSWPDPLVPERDAWDGERRNAFPFDVPARENRVVLVDICVDGGAKPGTRLATFEVRSATATLRAIPLRVRIERAGIPATASLPTSFGFSSRRAALGHLGRQATQAELERIDRRYREALLSRRISVHGGTMDPPPFRREKGRLAIDFTAYDRELGPFLGGAGARATTAELRTHPALRTDDERIRYWKAIAAHHREKGWKAILFDYGKDEPSRADLPGVASRARLVKRADASIRTLVTASLDPSLVGAVDVWAPNLNCLWIKSRAGEFCPWRASRESYDPLRAKGAMLWWYQSCSSHGCGDADAASPGAPQASKQDAAMDGYFRGWPTYVIDAPGTRARIMGWLAFAHGIEGELYWDTVQAYAPKGAPRNPWDGASLHAFGGNGDGTLLYPGTPARIGGTTHVPVESLRLLQIRDGLEDYELLKLVAAGGRRSEVARRAVLELAPAPFRVRDDPEAFERVRAGLLDALAGPVE